MAGWRQVVELAMTEEEIETLTALYGRRAGYRGPRCACVSREPVVPCRGTLGAHHQTVRAVWPTARCRPADGMLLGLRRIGTARCGQDASSLQPCD